MAQRVAHTNEEGECILIVIAMDCEGKGVSAIHTWGTYDCMSGMYRLSIQSSVTSHPEDPGRVAIWRRRLAAMAKSMLQNCIYSIYPYPYRP